jgi:hypothetical protein
MRINDQVDKKDERRNESKKVNPGCSPRKKIPSQLNAREPIRLYPPQAPRLLGNRLSHAGNGLLH